jgi:hypothetical protein
VIKPKKKPRPFGNQYGVRVRKRKLKQALRMRPPSAKDKPGTFLKKVVTQLSAHARELKQAKGSQAKKREERDARRQAILRETEDEMRAALGLPRVT